MLSVAIGCFIALCFDGKTEGKNSCGIGEILNCQKMAFFRGARSPGIKMASMPPKAKSEKCMVVQD